MPISSSRSTGFSGVVTKSAHKAAAFLQQPPPPLFFGNFLFSVGIDLISNVMFLFGVQELDSVIYRHTSILFFRIDYHSVFS